MPTYARKKYCNIVISVFESKIHSETECHNRCECLLILRKFTPLSHYQTRVFQFFQNLQIFQTNNILSNSKKNGSHPLQSNVTLQSSITIPRKLPQNQFSRKNKERFANTSYYQPIFLFFRF